MLSTMRGTVTGIFAKSLMMFLVVTFAVWGIGDVVRGGASPSTIITVGDSEITTQELGFKMQQVQRNAGEDIPPELLQSEGFRRQILQRMIEERLSEVAADDIGIVVGTPLIAKRTKENEMFQNIDRSFNPAAFEAYLRETQQGENRYRQAFSKEVQRDLFMASADLDQFTLPESYLQLTSLSMAEQRKAKIITIPAASETKIEEKELLSFYEDTKDVLYMQPETRDLRYAIISKASIDAAIKGDETGTALEDLSYALDDAIAAGQSMEDALKQSHLQAEVKTLSGVEAKAGSNELEKAAIIQGFALEEGEASGLLSDETGTYFMVSVKDIKGSEPKPFEAVKADVTKRYQEEKGAELAKEKADEIKTALNDKESLEEQISTARQLGGIVSDSPLLERPEMGINAGISEPLQRGIFNAAKGDVIGPVILKNGGYALAIVTEVIVPKAAENPDSKTQTALTSELMGQMYTLWVNALTARHPVKQVGALDAPAAQQ